tara:strand:+ start:377 stop:838 length:462 start_codon:yes stop_codon:yes gene_type:complete
MLIGELEKFLISSCVEMVIVYTALSATGESTLSLISRPRLSPIQKVSGTISHLGETIVEGRVMMIPAATYMAMNLLSFVALQHISSALFISIAQLKTLFTALASVLILGTSLDSIKWLSLIVLVAGNVFITLEEKGDQENGKTGEDEVLERKA